jgi:hypothetical protein
MVLADDIADDTRAFLESRGRIEFQLPHRIEETPMDRLEAITNVGQ